MKKAKHHQEKPIVKNAPLPKSGLFCMRGGVLTTDEEQAARKRQRLKEKYENASFFYKRGGIFTTITRNKLIAKSGQTDLDIEKNAFWCKVRKNIEKGLFDLALFIEATSDGSMKQVITQGTLTPVVSVLLQGPDVYPPHPDQARLYSERARIAQLFIKYGFDYLSAMNKENMVSLSHKRTMDDAIDLSQVLLATFPSEWPYYPEVHGKTFEETRIEYCGNCEHHIEDEGQELFCGLSPDIVCDHGLTEDNGLRWNVDKTKGK